MTVAISPRVQGQNRVRSEPQIDLLTAAEMFPRGNRWRPMSPRTVFRFIISGKPTPRGRVYLDAVRIGGHWHTSAEAIYRFVEAIK
jgi:hypothetical protein